MIDQIVVGSLGVNTYFVIDKNTKQGFVIDPGAQAQLILNKIKENDWKIHFILLTHGHYDHIGAAKELRETLGCPIVAHKKAKEYLENAAINLSSLFEPKGVEFKADWYITEDEDEYAGFFKKLPPTLAFKVFYAPGHTSDSIIFYFSHYEAAFVGDIIFRESIGRTDLRGGNSQTLLESIKTQVFTLPEQTILYPGHGPATTVAYEKTNNPYLEGF